MNVKLFRRRKNNWAFIRKKNYWAFTCGLYAERNKNEPYIIFYDLEPIGIKKDSNPRP